MKHIVFGESAAGTLNFTFKNEATEIIVFPDFLGEGPILELLTAQGLKERALWLEQAFRLDGLQWSERFKQAIEQLETLTEDDSVLIWASENAAEQFGLRLVCHELLAKHCAIYYCNTYENMLHMYRARNLQMEIRHTGGLNSKQVRHMFDECLLEQLSIETITQYAAQAGQLMQGDSQLRTWRRGEILEDVETRDDAMILHYLSELLQESSEPFIRAPRLIGHVLGFSVHDINDTWIEYRLLTLIKQGEVSYRGDLQQIRTYEVQ